jgi:hypothetical protein
MIKETYYSFKVAYDEGYQMANKNFNVKADSLELAYDKVIDLASQKLDLNRVSFIEYEGKDTFELYN